MIAIPELEILYQDEQLVVINKPAGIMVHRSSITEDKIFLLQILRNQIKQRVYPIHRLDRGTSGVLLFGKTREEAGRIQNLIQENKLSKIYLAIIRGFVDEEGTIDYPLSSDPHKAKQEAISHYKKLSQNELPFSVNRYPTSRYSLVEVRTETGRFHQIRKHFAHLRHPVIGDKKHGDCKHNKFFSTQHDLSGMMLHAKSTSFLTAEHKQINIEASLPSHFEKMLNKLSLSY